MKAAFFMFFGALVYAGMTGDFDAVAMFGIGADFVETAITNGVEVYNGYSS